MACALHSEVEDWQDLFECDLWDDDLTRAWLRGNATTEIDAAAFHAYGLDREGTQFVLDDFHRVRNPRLMTEDYFVRVLDEYDALA